MTKVKIKQFKDKGNNPVAGLTPEHAVYGSDGVRLDAKLLEIQRQAAQGATAEEIREAMENLPDGQAVSAQVAVNTAKVTDLERKVGDISAEEAETEVESIDLYNNDKTDLIFHLDNDGADIKNLKSNGKNVATEDNLESKQDKLKEVEAETQPISDNEIVIKDDSRNEVVGINKEGLRVKNIYNLAGKPFMGIVNEVSIYVKKNGGGDFTSVVAALKSIEGKADTIYNVYVYEGEYDMVSDWFGATSYNSTSLTYAQRQGVVVPRNTNIIGVGRKGHIILKGEFPSNVIFATSLAYSTINLRGYDNKMENVTITCFNARYAVHDQVGTECLAEYEHNFVNCDFIHKGFDAGATPAFEVTSSNNDSSHRWGSPHALGQGTNNTARVKAMYTSFRCESSYGVGFLTHDANNAANLGGSHIVFDCCKFENTKANGVISISSLGANTDNTIAIKDCYFPNTTPEIGGAISSQSAGGEFIYRIFGNKTNPNLAVSLPSGYDGNNWLR